ncbi:MULTISPECIES: hypothetical protein [Enterobacteriaceae]|uniref:hypothetical protein n=1 Tax=Enterobacteriaceae TaxID=543 RepID=UPI0015D67B1F|nr:MULTISPECIES: hypothetical protein [Enterobacteriaceae]MCU6243854.1 hypothetical protein [Enterobacter asburiae]
MVKKSEYFTSFDEIKSRPEFSDEQIISPENFKELVGEYLLEHDVKCQVERNGFMCLRDHKHGWLGKTHEGVEALIGSNCATNYFKADKTFILERKRVKDETKRLRALSRLKLFHDDRSNYLGDLAKIKELAIQSRVDFDFFHKNFPNSVLKFITQAQKTQNWNLKVDALVYSNDDSDGVWGTHILRKVNALPQKHEIFGIIDKVKKIKIFFEQSLEINPENIRTPKLIELLNVISEKDKLLDLAIDISKNTAAFMEPRNLDSLIYTCDDREDEFITARVILQATKAKVSSSGHVNLRIKRIKDRTEQQLGAAQVRKSSIIEKFERSSVFN